MNTAFRRGQAMARNWVTQEHDNHREITGQDALEVGEIVKQEEYGQPRQSRQRENFVEGWKDQLRRLNVIS
jgi:hypothetical protein